MPVATRKVLLMTEIEVVLLCVELARHRLRAVIAARGSDRGDVAEKVVLVGIFVALAIAVGVIIARAVTVDATHISREISR
jgi:hypothetical protein